MRSCRATPPQARDNRKRRMRALPIALPFVALALAASCLQPVRGIEPPEQDSGFDAGPDAGIPDGGAPDSGSGACALTDAGLPFGWTPQTICTTSPLCLNNPSAMDSIAASGPSLAIAGGHDGNLYWLSGASAFSQLWTPSSTGPALTSVFISPQQDVVAVGGNSLVVCTSPPCNANTKFSATSLGSSQTVEGACGADGTLFSAVGSASGQGYLTRYQSGWVPQGPTPLGPNHACWVAPDGGLFIAASEGILEIEATGTLTEPLLLEDAGVADAGPIVAVTGGLGWEVGASQSGWIFEHQDAGWVRVAVTGHMLHAFATTGTEAFFADPVSASPPLIRYAPDACPRVTTLGTGPAMTVVGVAPAGANAIYAAGASAGTAAISFGSR